MQHKLLADTQPAKPEYTFRDRSREREVPICIPQYGFEVPYRFVFTFLKGHDGQIKDLLPEERVTLGSFFASRAGQKFISVLTERKWFSNSLTDFYPRIEIVSLPQKTGYRPAQRGTLAFSVNWLLEEIKENRINSLITYLKGAFLETNSGKSVFMTLPEERNWFFRYMLPARERYTLMSDIPVTELPVDWLCDEAKTDGIAFYDGRSMVHLNGKVILFMRDDVLETGTPANFISVDERLRFISILMKRFNSPEGRTFVDFLERMGMKTMYVYPDNDAQVVKPDNMEKGDLCITTTAFLTLSWKELRQGIYDIYDQLLSITPLQSKSVRDRVDHMNKLMGSIYINGGYGLRVYPGQEGAIIFEKGYR